MKIAIVGTRGLPNNYGGFETLAEYIVKYLAKELDITVFCSSKDLPERKKEYNGAKLRYIPITSHGALGIVYDSISLLIAVRKYDKVLFLGFGGGFVMPFLKHYKNKIIVNIGGLDWKRDKWSSKAQKVIKKAEEYLIRNAYVIISDNKGIQDYLLQEYSRTSTFISYGGDQVKHMAIKEGDIIKYPFLSSDYAFIVTRIQPDNNITMLINAFDENSDIPLVIVGNWKSSHYGINTKKTYQNKENVYLLDEIYNQDQLNLLRSNCTIYIHGHSAGGTNPSLVEAMNLGLPVFAYASGYNENTTFNEALYFKNSKELKLIIDNYKNINLQNIGEKLKSIAEKYYQWNIVTEQYKQIFYK